MTTVQTVALWVGLVFMLGQFIQTAAIASSGGYKHNPGAVPVALLLNAAAIGLFIWALCQGG